MEGEPLEICGRCHETMARSSEWWLDLCPECADATEGDWRCQRCGKHGDFEETGGDGDQDPECCGVPCIRIRESTLGVMTMQELKLFVPTYNANYFEAEVESGAKEEFGDPNVPVLIREAEGVRIVLGTHDYEDFERPDIWVERQPNGWVIFLHSVGGSDENGYVCFHDDGRCFLQKGVEPIEILEAHEKVPGFDDSPPPTHDDVSPSFVTHGQERPNSSSAG
jgi:hypothetical protein